MGRLRRGISSLRDVSLAPLLLRFQRSKPRGPARGIYICCRCIRRQWNATLGPQGQGRDFRASRQGTPEICSRTHARMKDMLTTAAAFRDACQMEDEGNGHNSRRQRPYDAVPYPPPSVKGSLRYECEFLLKFRAGTKTAI